MLSRPTGRRLLRARIQKLGSRRHKTSRQRFLALEQLHERAMFVVYFTEGFANNTQGWTLGPEWQIGSATPSAGHAYGNADPGSDNTPTADNGVAGIVIGGNASTALHGFNYLTSPAIDTTGATNLSLDFARWLNSDYTPYMQNTIEVFDGSSWNQIFITGGSPGVQDASWTQQSYDIFAYSNANLQVRFGMQVGPSGGAYNVSSWNIDDVVVQSILPLSLPFTEDFADNSQGWALGPEWQIGSATTSTGHVAGTNPDPGVDNTPTADNGIAGIVIGGNASTAIHGYNYLTSPAINTTGATNLTLSFARWLNSDYTPYMQNIIEVFDGSTWNQIFVTGGAPGVTDASWSPQTYDILPFSNANLRVRFGIQVGPTGGAFNVSSWNLDDVVIQSVVPATLPFTENFANNSQGWSLGPEWQTGSATPSAGHAYGFADPGTDNTPTADNGIAGIVIGGNASTALHGYYYLTSPVINTTGATNLTLSFARWLNSDYTPYMQNIVEVFDGSTWNQIFLTAGAPGVQDSAWTPQTYNIQAFSNANLQVRFGVQVASGGAYTVSSWNLDDVVIESLTSNDNFANAVALPSLQTAQATGSNVGSTGEVGEPNNHGISAPIQSNWWTWTAPVSGAVEINTQGSSFDTSLGVYTGTAVNTLTTIASNDDFYGLQSAVTFNAVAGTTYRISVDSFSGGTGNIVLNVWQLNDLFARAFTLTGSVATGTSSNVGATGQTGEPNHAGVSIPIQSSWWNWTAPVTAVTEIHTQGSGFDTTLGVYTGAAVNALTLVASNDDFYGLQSSVTFNAIAGTMYRIAVDGFTTATNGITVNVVQSVASDYDDAPASYGSASHTGIGVTLGALRDTETATFDTAGATGDDLNGTDDEDGIVISSLSPGGTGSAVVNAQGVVGTAFLQGWIDFNNDGTFGAGEQIATNLAITVSGSQTITFAVPPTTVVGNLVSRFRISTTSGLLATGTAANGEVEDHIATVAVPATVYVAPTFTTIGAAVDGDLTAAGVQSAVVGFNAFATITQALAVVAASGTAILNTGTYAEAPVVTKVMTEIRGYSATMNSLTTNSTIGINGTISATPGGLDFNSPMTLVGNTTLNSAGVVDFTGANVNALSSGGQSLAISAPTAAVTLAGVGATTAVSTLTVTSTALTGSGNISTTGGATATVTAASSITGIIGGAGALTKLGAGVMTISATNTYTGTTNVNAGTLQLQNGNAILNTAGAVNVALGATLSLLTSETVSSYVGAGDIGVGTNDSTLALANNVLTTTGAAALGNVTVGTTGGVVAGTSITDNDDDNNVTGTGLFLQATTGVGVVANPIETTLANVEASGGTGGVFLANAGNLAIGGVSALVGLSASGGDIVVTAAGSLTVNENVTATGAGTDVSLATIDAAAVGQNLTINAGFTVSSAAASIVLNSGDDVIVAGNLTSGTTTTINVDVANADVGTGGALSISGVITTPVVGSGGGTFLNGQTDNDTFTFNPQTTTEFRLFGDAPVGVTPGDTLVMNVTGTTNPNLTIPGSLAPYSGLGSGAWSFTSAHRPVLFGSIEQSNITGTYHLTYNNSIAPVGNLFVMRDPTQTNLQLRSGSTAGSIIYQASLANILSLRILGSAGNDIVTVDDVNTLPNFGSTVPGVADNANLTGTAELLFDGLGGTDTLVYNITGATASQQYAIGNGTGTAGSQGEIETVAAGINLLTYFQNVESTQRTGTGATPAGLTVIGDSGANDLSLQAAGAATLASATGYTPFSFSGNNYSAITVNSLAGTDSIALISLGTGQTNNPTITFNGGTEVDTLSVQSTSGNTGSVTLNGNSGSDLFQLFSSTNTVDGIVGPVIVDGSDGNVVGNTDTLVIIDSGDLTADSVVISAVSPGTSADYAVEGITSTVGNDVVFRNIDSLDYTGTSAGDTIDGRFVSTVPLHDLSTVTLSGWLGADQFLLFTSDQLGGSGAGFTPTGLASGIATISLFGDAPGNPNAGDGNDIFGLTPVGVTGTGASNVGLLVPDTTRMIRPSVSTAIAIDGGQPTGLTPPVGDAVGDVSNVDISALPTSSPVIVSTFSPGQVLATGIQPLTWTQIEDINLVDQGEMTNVQMGDLFMRTTPANDLVQLSRNTTALNPNQVRVRITTLLVNLSASNKTVVYSGGGNDTITQSNLLIPAEFYGEGGDDYISGGVNNDWIVGGLGDDSINGSHGDNIIWGDNSPTLPSDPAPQDLAIGGDDLLSGLGGSDVFYGGGGNDLVSGGGGDDYAYGGQGNDILDGFEGSDRLYGGLGNDVITGHAGNDLLSAGTGDDQLYGVSGNDVLIAGAGADSVDGGEGNDLLVSGSVANQNSIWAGSPVTSTFAAGTYINPADNDFALMTLLSQWSSAGNRTTIAAITHDGADDDFFGSLGDDDFCWENLDVLEDFPAPAGADFNAVLMGSDERFGPLS